MNKWIYTAISALFAVSSAFGQEFDDMYFTKADREALSAKPAAQPYQLGSHDFPNTPERQAQQNSRFSNPDGVGTGYGYQYYAIEDGVVPSSIPTTGNAYMEATQGMSIEEQQNGKSGGFFSNPSVSLGMSAGTFGTGTSIGIGFGNSSAFSLGLGIGMGMGMGMYPGYGMGYPMYGMGMGYPGYGYPMYGMRPGYPYPGYGYGGMYDPMYGYGYPYPGYGYGRYPIYVPVNPDRGSNPRVAQRPSSTMKSSPDGIRYPQRYKNAMANNGVGTVTRPSSSSNRSATNWGSSRPSNDPFNNNSFRRPTNTGSSFRSTTPSMGGSGRSTGSAGRSVRRR